jgi:hypothetical protein
LSWHEAESTTPEDINKVQDRKVPKAPKASAEAEVECGNGKLEGTAELSSTDCSEAEARRERANFDKMGRTATRGDRQSQSWLRLNYVSRLDPSSNLDMFVNRTLERLYTVAQSSADGLSPAAASQQGSSTGRKPTTGVLVVTAPLTS